jgi:hypothetical protein
MIAVVMVMVAVVAGATMAVTVVPATRQAETGDQKGSREKHLTHMILLMLQPPTATASICSTIGKWRE